MFIRLIIFCSAIFLIGKTSFSSESTVEPTATCTKIVSNSVALEHRTHIELREDLSAETAKIISEFKSKESDLVLSILEQYSFKQLIENIHKESKLITASGGNQLNGWSVSKIPMKDRKTFDRTPVLQGGYVQLSNYKYRSPGEGSAVSFLFEKGSTSLILTLRAQTNGQTLGAEVILMDSRHSAGAPRESILSVETLGLAEKLDLIDLSKLTEGGGSLVDKLDRMEVLRAYSSGSNSVPKIINVLGKLIATNLEPENQSVVNLKSDELVSLEKSFLSLSTNFRLKSLLEEIELLHKKQLEILDNDQSKNSATGVSRFHDDNRGSVEIISRNETDLFPFSKSRGENGILKFKTYGQVDVAIEIPTLKQRNVELWISSLDLLAPEGYRLSLGEDKRGVKALSNSANHMHYIYLKLMEVREGLRIKNNQLSFDKN